MSWRSFGNLAFTNRTVVDEYITFEHQPCPKFRIAVPLLRPWMAADYASQDVANAAWKERIESLAAALHLKHDQACVDTSRVFFLPRRPANGPPSESAVLPGIACDIFVLLPVAANGPEEAPTMDTDTRRRGDDHDGAFAVFTDPETGEVVDLRSWAHNSAGRFEIEQALRARRPQSFTGKLSDGRKYHIRCVNEAAHTDPGVDAATMVINASASANWGFVYHCRHAHCDGRDRLFFVKQMLEQSWLTVGDLSDPTFQMEPAMRAQDDTDIELTEHGVAVTFARRSERTLRYCHSAGAWYVWSGAHWAKNDTQCAFDAARRLVATLNRKTDFKTRAFTGRASFANAVERFAQADQTLAVTAAAWNTDPWLLATPDGTVDLRTGVLRPARPRDYMTRLTAVTPTDIAACPKFLAFLQQASGNDVPMMEFLQRWFGYCLTGITREHALIFLYGPGGNGKGVLLQTIGAILSPLPANSCHFLR